MTKSILFYFVFASTSLFAQEFPKGIQLGPNDTTFEIIRQKAEVYINYHDSIANATQPNIPGQGNQQTSIGDGDNDIHKNFQTWKNYMSNRLGVDGSVISYQRNLIDVNTTQPSFKTAFPTSTLSQNVKWQPLGPDKDEVGSCGPFIGLIQTILPLKETPNREILVSTGNDEFGVGGGIFKTYDGGENWKNTTDDENFSVYNFGDIVKDPLNNNLIFAGISGNGFGMIYSEDGGEVWKKTGLYNYVNVASGAINWNNFTRVVKILVSPSNHPNGNKNILYLGQKVVYQSSTNGVEDAFVRRADLDQYSEFRDASIVNNSSLKFIIVTFNKILVSSNNAASFSANNIFDFVSSEMVGSTSYLFSSVDKANIQISGNNVFIHLACRFVNGTNAIIANRMIVSTDGGNTFNQLNIPSSSLYTRGMSPVFTVSPLNPSRWYMERGGNAFGCADLDRNIYISTNNGSTFSRLTGASTADNGIHGDQRIVKVLSSNATEDILISGNDGGVSIFENGSWHNANGKGLNIGRLYSAASTEKMHDIVLSGSHDDGTNFYQQGIWTNFMDGDKFDAILDINNANQPIRNLVSNYQMGNLTSTPPNSSSFSPFSITKVKNNTSRYFAIRKNDNPSLGCFVFQSNDHGAIWNAITTIPVCSIDCNPTDICISPDESTIFFVNKGYRWKNGQVYNQNNCAGVYRMTFTNNTWSTPVRLTNGLYDQNNVAEITAGGTNATPLCNYHELTSVMINPEVTSEVWVTLGGANKWNGSTHKVYKSTDNGNTWVDWSNGLPAVSANCIAFQEKSGGRIFVGTDLGVFYINNSNDPIWKYYGGNQVGNRVNALEINYCSQRIYAATWGRGLWCAPIFPETTTYVEGITNVIQANETTSPDGDIVLEEGAVLTVRGTILMNADKKITINKNATLIVDGGTIKKQCNTNTFWEGIEMVGDDKEVQNPVSSFYDFNNGTFGPSGTGAQPVCILKNAKIENARTAVHVGKIVDGLTNSNYSGGILIADRSTFKNNNRAVEFVKYNYRDPNFVPTPQQPDPPQVIYQAQFRKCHFEWNNYVDPTPEAMVTNWGTNGVKFYDCTFENKTPLSQPTNEIKGRGIYSIDGSVVVGSACLRNVFGECYCSEPPCDYGCKFINLYRGVDVQGTALAKNVGISKVFNSTFQNCLYAVRYLGMNNPEITYNIFNSNLNSLSTNFTGANASVGIHLEGNSAVRNVTKNEMNGTYLNSNISAQPMVGTNWGIVVAGGGLMDASIYQNTINNYTGGMVSLGTNGSSNSGLLWKCNRFEETYLDIDAFKGTDAIPNYFLNIPLGTYNDPNASIHAKQGDCGVILAGAPIPQIIEASKKPANNIFTTNISYLPPGYNLMVNAQHFDLHGRTGMSPYTYYYPDVTTIRFEPINFSSTFINKLQCKGFSGTEIQEEDRCARLTNPDNPYGLKVLINDKIWVIADFYNQFHNIDAAVETLDRDMDNANGNTIGSIISDLIQQEYTPPAVLNHAINHPFISFALPQLKQLLIKNSALEDSTIYYLVNANLSYTTEELNELLSHQMEQSPYRRFKEYPLTLASELQGLKIDLANLYIDLGYLDSARAALMQDTTATSLELALPLCIALEQCDRVQTILNSLAQKNIAYYAPYVIYYNILCREKTNLHWDWKNADSSIIDTLKLLAQSNTPIAAKAVAALSHITRKEYKEPIPDIDIEAVMKTHLQSKEKKDTRWSNFRSYNTKTLKVYPNPNKGKFTVSITGKQIGNVLEVYNYSGAKVANIPIEYNTANSKEVELSALPSGIYSMVMKDSDKSVLGQIPFIINNK